MNAILIATVIATGQVQTMGFSSYVSCLQYAQQHSQQETYEFKCVPTPNSIGNTVSQNFYNTARIINIFNNLVGKAVNE